MLWAIEALNRWSVEWAALVVALVWQSTLVAALVAFVAYLLRRSSPAARYWLWQIVAIKLLMLPFWTWSVPLPWLAAEPARPILVAPATVEPIDIAPRQVTASAPSDRQPAWTLDQIGWRAWLLLGWAAVVAAQVVRLAVQHHRLSRLLKASTPAPDELIATVRGVAERLQLKRPPAVLITDIDCSPFVCGIVRPKLVLSRSLAASLPSAELCEIVAHELAHVRRHDLVWGWIPELARVLWFFHPVAHWAAYRVRLERELACDQWAMAQSGRSPAEYAETLVRVISAASQPSIFRTSAAASLDGNTPLADKPAARKPTTQ